MAGKLQAASGFIDTEHGQMPVSTLRIGYLWNTPERAAFHGQKEHLRKQLRESNFDLRTLYHVMQIDESWIKVEKGDAVPANFDMLLYIWNRYMTHYRKFHPPLLYRMFIRKLTLYALALYKEDTAYTTRIGGCIQYILENSEEWGVKEDRLLLLKDLQQWWEEEDWRDYSKDFLRGAFNVIIDKYEHEPFVRQSVDFFIDNILVNKHNWMECEGYFRPESWYPRGMGQVNYLVHGRRV